MLYKHRYTGEVMDVDAWMQRNGWTEEIEFDQGSDDLIAVDASEVAMETLRIIADPKAELPKDGRETCRIYEDMAQEALAAISGKNTAVRGRRTLCGVHWMALFNHPNPI